jgi:predicted lipid-binding transport protein (Tim44 family)
MIILCTFGLFFSDAQAKRFGSGKSFGTQRTMSHFSRPSSLSNMTQPFSSAKKWLAPLAGLAIGGLIASLFMGHGIGSSIISWLVIGSILFLLFNLIRKKIQPTTEPIKQNIYTTESYSEHTRNNTSSPMFNLNSNLNNIDTQSNNHYPSNYPINFNVDEFLREAKAKFIRLQSAYDQKNLNDLREFTTPDVFAEIQLQLHERGHAENKTDVLTLEAELLEATTEFQIPVASVRFSGSIREDNNTPNSLNEIWHFRKDHQGIHWVVSGIQQQ